MLYFLSAFLIFILFLSFQRDKRTSVKYLVSTLFFYVLAILFMILYLSKDVRYYNIIENYFNLPRSFWKTLMFLPVSKDMLIRLMNLFSLLTLFFGCQFSLTYQEQNNAGRILWIRKALRWLLVTEWVIYEPLISRFLYLFFYPHVMNSTQYALFLQILHALTVILNHLLVILSILNLFQANRQIYSFPYFKYFAYGETISYTLTMVSYLVLFGQLPQHMVRYSVISGYTSYHSLTLYSNTAVYDLFPYYLFGSALLMSLSVVMLVLISNRLNDNDFTMSRQIDAANTTSKTFCHYMKNELLALQAEVQMLEVDEEGEEDRTHIIERCQNLYSRLDVMHRSTKTSKLTLESTDLETLIRRMLDRMSTQLEGYTVRIHSGGTIPPAMVDPNFFEQALHNIVTNAIDAMENLPPERRSLSITLRSIDNWIALSVTDTGPGIAQNNLNHIFEPFFSSQPIAEHWGIGLTMTYRIVKAHNGRITVESREGKGTTFRILLPNLKKMVL